jgi:hypothetical protein
MSTKTRFLSMFFLFCLIFSGTVMNNVLLAQKTVHSSVIIKKCKDFKVTGDGSSGIWKSTGWLNVTKQGSGTSTYKTKVKVLYSENGLYFLYDCEDKKLTTTMKADYMDLYNEDVVELFLWTDESFPVYFEYEVSPLNYELPIIIPNNKGTFFGWLPWHYEGERKTQHATSVTGGKKESGCSVSGWMAEIFIPFKLLTPLSNVPAVSGTKWRANMYRLDYDNGTTQFAWSKTGNNFHEYNNFGTFIFE